VKISGLPFGNPETKCHLDMGLVEKHTIYYKGEGGGSPQVCSWLALAPKVLQLCTNQFVV